MEPVDRIVCGDALEELRKLDAGIVHCCVTSPPYWGLRDYGVPGQIGLEKTPEAYVERMVTIFQEVRRVLKREGTLWLNLGDSYAHDQKSGPQGSSGERVSRTFTASGRGGLDHGLKPKDLVGIPWRVAFALQADGWYLRSDIVWSKPNPMPESVTDRPTKAHEYIFLLAKSERYYYDADAIREPYKPASLGRYDYDMQSTGGRIGGRQPGGEYRIQDEKIKPNVAGRNKRSVWTVTTQPYPEAHFATFPPKLIEPCILAGCPPGGIVLDPFVGAGTTGLIAAKHGRRYLGIELNAEYVEMAERRLGAERSQQKLEGLLA